MIRKTQRKLEETSPNSNAIKLRGNIACKCEYSNKHTRYVSMFLHVATKLKEP
jgi:hypothetical protein